MTRRKTFALLALALVLGAAAWARLPYGAGGIAPAEAAMVVPDVQDLVGGRATAGESQFLRRGYVVARMRGLDTYWWHQAEARCVHSRTEQGLYQGIEAASAPACGR